MSILSKIRNALSRREEAPTPKMPRPPKRRVSTSGRSPSSSSSSDSGVMNTFLMSDSFSGSSPSDSCGSSGSDGGGCD